MGKRRLACQCRLAAKSWHRTNDRVRIPTAGIMEELVAEGAVIVTTSNRPPWELQDHGLHEVRRGLGKFTDALGCLGFV